jgi:hypothetical protein
VEPPVFQGLKFDALRNALYHTERRSFLDLLNRLLSFLVILFGTAVVSKLGDKRAVGPYVEVGTVVLATIQLVFDFGGGARTHDFLQRRYYEFLSEIEEKGIAAEDEQKLGAKLLLICSEEPMTMRALDAVAYNKAIDATISDPTRRKRHRIKLNWWQRMMRNLVAFTNTDFAPASPLPEDPP